MSIPQARAQESKIEIPIVEFMDEVSNGSRIKMLREERGMDRRTFARIIHLTPEAVGLIERDLTTRPHPGTRERVKAVLGVDVFSEIRGGHVTA